MLLQVCLSLKDTNINLFLDNFFLLPGMLSISQTEKLPPKLAVKASLKKKSHSAMFPTREEKINKVHQDEDFIYPTLGAALSLI